MKKIILGAASILVLFSCSNKRSVKLKKEEDSVSYAIGLDIAKNFRENKLDTIVVSEAVAQGLIDGLAKNPTYVLNPDSAQKVLQKYTMKLRENQRKATSKKFEKNVDLGKKFLDDNKKQAGIIVTASGLQYKIEKAGTGAKPAATDIVKVNYKGSTIEGKVFDSSYDRKEPATFPVSGGIIPGWSEALQLMTVGSKWTIYVPQQLAYGEEGRMPTIEPYSTLIFEIELISIEPPKK